MALLRAVRRLSASVAYDEATSLLELARPHGRTTLAMIRFGGHIRATSQQTTMITSSSDAQFIRKCARSAEICNAITSGGGRCQLIYQRSLRFLRGPSSSSLPRSSHWPSSLSISSCQKPQSHLQIQSRSKRSATIFTKRCRF